MTLQKSGIGRRRFLSGTLSAAGVMLAGCTRMDPPTYGNLLRVGDNLTYRAHRLLLPEQSLVREYTLQDVTSMPALNTTNPGDPAKSSYSESDGPIYERLLANDFKEWRISISGSVERPSSFSLADLRRMPSRTQITRHTCEEGWTAIAQWTGVQLSHLLHLVGVKPTARFVQYYSFDNWGDGIDMLDALHPQTILAYGMNGADLPLAHGAPVRIRVERQLGYKSMKYLKEIVVTDSFDDNGPIGNIQNGWAWYAGI